MRIIYLFIFLIYKIQFGSFFYSNIYTAYILFDFYLTEWKKILPFIVKTFVRIIEFDLFL